MGRWLISATVLAAGALSLSCLVDIDTSLIPGADAVLDGDGHRLDLATDAGDGPRDGPRDHDRDGASDHGTDGPGTLDHGVPSDTDKEGPTVCTWTKVTSGTSVELFDVHGTSSTDIWAVGQGGTVLHDGGSGWSAASSNTSVDLNGVWALAASDVWVVGAAGTVAHYDGSSWAASSIANKPLNDAWGSAANDVWAVGDGGTAMHWDGASWSSQSTPANVNLLGVWGSAANDIWASGSSAVIVRYDGSSWVSVGGIPGHNYHGVSGRSKTAAWIAGRKSVGGINYPVAMELSGASWVENDPNDSDVRLYAVWVDPASGEVWMTGRQGSAQGPIFRYDGNAWTKTHTAGAILNGIWGTSACDLWAVGVGGTVLHRGP